MQVRDFLDFQRPLTSNALRHDVVVRVLASIFQGTLPAGTRLVIRKMAEQMGVSATPIREALVELEGIGLVQFSHNRGTVIKPFGPQQLRDIYHLRRVLESEAARCACGRIPCDDLKSLRREIRQLLIDDTETPEWSQKAMVTDRKLHDLTAKYCGNARLADEINRYNTLIQTIREIMGNRRHVQQMALKEHMPIINALLAGDPERAAAAMVRHVKRTLKSIETVMFQQQ